MSTKRKIKTAVAVSDKARDLEFLGRLVTYTLPDQEQNGAKVVRAWAEHGLDPDDLPVARQPVHVFESAVRKQETRRVNGRVEVVLVDRVVTNAAECVYQVTRQVRDKQSEVVNHEKSMRVRFNKRTSKITIDKLEPDAYRALKGIEKAIRDDFDANAKTVPGQKLRNAIRQKVLAIGGQSVRRNVGGLYFVPDTYMNGGGEKPTAPVLGDPVIDGNPPPAPNGLTGFLHDLYADDADFYAVPLLAGDSEAAMVRKHFALNAAEEARELTEKAWQRVRQGKTDRGVRSDLLANLQNARRRLVGGVQQFEELVDFERGAIAQELDDLDSALELLTELANES